MDHPGAAIYYADIAAFEDLAGLHLLTPARRENTFRFRRQEDQMRSLAAGLLVRRYVGSGEPERGPYGKPFFPGLPQFSLSHSGRYVVLAVSGNPIGVDTEEIRPWSERVARRCFKTSELRWLARQPEQESAFYVLWTAKESVMKATGDGFHMPPESFRVWPEKSVGVDAHGTAWHLKWFSLPGNALCLAAAEDEKEVPLMEASRRELLQ